MKWIGPVEIPQDRIDYSDEDSWAATRDKKRVKHFAQRLEAGDEVAPAVAVQKPGDAKVTVVDGRHRALAERKLKRPLRCYVGFPDKDHGPWDRMSDFQQRTQDVGKSAETPHLVATPDLLGTEGLWHTPDRHVDTKQKLPNYIEHIAHALERDQGMGEQEAIATAINAVKRWAKGDLHWGHGHVTPEVIHASQDALRQWAELKQSHH